MKTALVCAVAASLLAGPARGDDKARDAFERVDPDTALLVVVRPRALGTMVDWLNTFGGALKPMVGEVLAQAGAATRPLGFELDKPATWSETGIDLESPVVMAALAPDLPAVEKAFKGYSTERASARSRARVARPWNRMRVVVRLGDPAKAKKLFDTLAAASRGKLVLVEQPQAVDAVWKGAAKALARAKVDAFVDDDGKLSFFRFDGDWLLVDVLIAWGHETLPFDWKREGAGVLRTLARQPAPGGATAILGRGAGRRVADADLAIWIDPGGLLDMARAEGWQKVAATALDMDPADRAPLVQQGAREVARCEELRPIVAQGAFEDAALTAKLTRGSAELSQVWGLRRSYALGAALLTANDGLLDVASSSDAAALGAVYLNGLAPLRALPRPGVMARGFGASYAAMGECGKVGALVGVLAGWPQLIAMGLDDLAAKDAKVADVVGNVRNLAFAMRTFSANERENYGVAVASFAAGANLDWIAETMPDAKPQTLAIGKKTITWWAPNPNKPALVRAPLDGGKTAWGFVNGGTAVMKWFWGKSAGSASPGVIALARADLPKIMEQVGRSLPMAAPYLDELRKRLGLLTLTLAIEDDLLVGNGRLEIK